MSTEKSLEMATGCPVFVEINNQPEKLKSHIVGFEHQKFVIIANPLNSNGGDQDWNGDTRLILKYVLDGVVIAFQAPLIHVLQSPAKLLFLAYPTEITRQNLRGWKRYKCNFAASVSLGNQEYEARVVDISLGGCCCSIASNLLGSASGKDVGDKIEIAVQHPESRQMLKLSSSISNSWIAGDHSNFGTAFTGLSNDQERLVKDLIFTTLHV